MGKMGLYLKITAGLLLLAQASHLATIPDSTDSPGKTIDKGWLRGLSKNTVGGQNTGVPEEKTEDDQGAMESSNDFSSGIPSGSMAIFNEEEEHVSSQDKDEGSPDQTVVTTTMHSSLSNVTTTKHEVTLTTESTNPSQINMTDAEEEFNNSTITPQNSTNLSAQNSTDFSDYSNHTDLQTTTSAPESNATLDNATKTDEDTRLTNATETTSTTTTTTTTTTTVTTTTMPEINETAATPPSTTAVLSETTEATLATSTAAAPKSPEKANKTDKGSASGSSSERGLESGPQSSRRKGAWGAVLGTAVAVACVGLVAYIILKKKHQKGFSHRKLVEEFPSDPVLRLDNSEPLDLNFGGSAYYNPGLQGDNIQMSSFPGRRGN
ncbi:Mucin-15 [Collichthys lucidus]|uniref:Mucin-15 n=1 Tax=Collichthys lucidus TaxID=240159 RepID=A0A4U5U6N6_COLLU|nr:Mucin-15 [Collichthys lucidus]